MSLSALAVKYRPIVLTLVVLLMLWGGLSVWTMPRREDPEYTVRTCVVTTSWPGAPAEKVEALITKPLEEILDQIDEVDLVHSNTIVGLSTIYVDAEDYVSPEQIDNVWDKVRARVKRVQMPEPAIVPDVNDEFGDTAVILLAVYQTPLPGEKRIREENRYTLRELDVISEKVKDELRLLPGVAKSEQYGVVEEAIYVQTDMGTWSQLSLTTEQLAQLAQHRNIVAAGGSIDTDAGRFSVKPGGEFDAVEEMGFIVAGMAGKEGEKRPVYLKDLGLEVVRDYEEPPRLICRYGDAHTSRPAVIVALTMKSGANIIDICEAAKARVREVQQVEQNLPADVAVAAVSDQSENVKAKIGQVVGNVVGAIAIVIVVVYLVVGFRSAAVMAANIPVVVLASLAVITLFGVQLEQISLASIIIALGLLVDNAVQVCDQSRTNQIKGMGPTEATVKGSSQLSTAMLMGTATTVAAFAPMLIALTGSRKEYVYSLPVTLSTTLAISWVLAMTFCTILAATFIRAPKDPGRPGAPLPRLLAGLQGLTARRGMHPPESEQDDADLLDKLFRLVVRTAIRFKFVTLGVAIALLVAAVRLPVGSEYFPKDLRDQFAIQVWLPESATIYQTDAAARQVEEMLRKLSPTLDDRGKTVEQIRAMRTTVGGGGARWYLGWDPEPRKPNYAEILVRTSDPRFTPRLARRVRQVAERGEKSLGLRPVVGARVVPRELYMGPSSDPVEIRIVGPGFADMKTLRGYADRVKSMVRSDPGTWDVNDSWGVATYQLRVDVEEDKANLAGVTNAGIAQTLNAYFSGHHLTTFREGDHLVPAYLRLKSPGRNDRTRAEGPDRRLPFQVRGSLEDLETAFVEGAYGKVPLDSVATITAGWQPSTIVRRDLNRVIEVRAQVEPGVRGNDVVNRVMGSDDMKRLRAQMPGGYGVEVGGALEDSREAAGQIAVSFSISLLTIVLLLVIQYNGWAKPLIILTTLPMALIGALPGLWITGNPLGFMPQLGILSLFGIVLNTGIIFIEFADLLIREEVASSEGSGPICGLTREQFRACLVEAGKQRLLPIFLTTATTIGGLLPLALAGGPLWEGMAWCMIFGLIVATLLTLLVIPSLYAILVEHFRVRPVRLGDGAA